MSPGELRTLAHRVLLAVTGGLALTYAEYWQPEYTTRLLVS